MLLQADWTWIDGRFQSGVQVEISPQGTMGRLGRSEASADHRLQGRALIPGLVSAHSHAFQRGLRGRGESFPSGLGSFWTWRQEMYDWVASADVDKVFRVSLQAFAEMLSAGITTVGEFHYLHHDQKDDWALDEAVLAAAHEAGIRLVLIHSYYRSGGIGKPLEPAQRRFACSSPSDYWRRLDRLEKRMGPRQTLAASVHSIRAAPVQDIREIHREACKRGMPFHIHVEEQVQEIEDCRRAYGVGPLELLLRELDLGSEFTAVHCTHSRVEDLHRLAAVGAHICLCPLTEANLGDGLPNLPAMIDGGASLCIGTDSNSRLSLWEELRWLEYGQRLHRRTRGVVRDAQGECAGRLFEWAVQGGSASLGLQAGLAVGGPADFVLIDQTSPQLEDVPPERLMDALVFGCGNAVIDSVWVGGQEAPT